jgi:protein-tyrosine-phosphatase
MTATDLLSKSDRQRIRILFVCTGNTCRSVFAEYIARHRFGDVIEAASVGVRPQTAVDAASAIETLKELGIDASGHQPRGLDEVDPEAFDRVVTLEPYVARKFKAKFPCFPEDRLTKWNINDPWDDPAAYKGCAEKIYAQLRAFLKTLASPA